MRVLVTGAEGFIGTVLVRTLRERWADRTPLIMSLGPAPRFELRDPAIMDRIERFDPEVIFHLAALHFIPDCVRDPIETLEINSIVTDTLLRCTRARTFVLASSAAVYGLLPVGSDRLYEETDDLVPIDVYGLSKLWAEQALRLAALREPDRRHVAARLFNVVGEGDPHPHLLPLIVGARGGTARLDKRGLAYRRDYVAVEDVAAALVDLATDAGPGFTAVNVSTGVGHTGWDLCSRYDVEVNDNPQARRSGPGGDLIGAPDTLWKLTGRRPLSPFAAEAVG